MEKIYTLLLLLLLSSVASGQVGINTASPNATLDVVSKGNTNATKALEINNSSAIEMVTILDNGNVGIGTSIPKDKLDVVGDISLSPSTNASSIKFYENSTNGSNNISLKAPSNVTVDRVITLPSNAPQSGFVLVTDNSGNTSWGSTNPADTTLASVSLSNNTIGSTSINPVAGNLTNIRFFQKFDTEIIDPSNVFTTSGSNVYTYTAPQAGNYMIAAYIVPNSNPTNNTSGFFYPVNLEVRKNCLGNPSGGTNLMDSSSIRYATPGVTSLRYSVVVTGMTQLSLGDTLDLVVLLNGTQATAIATEGVSFPTTFTYAGVADYKAYFSITAL